MSRQQQRFTYLSKPTEKLLDDFGAGNAAPGSGSAAALMGLLSAKLIVTVCKKSVEYSKNESDIKVFNYFQEQIENETVPRLKELFEKDAADFGKVTELIRKSKKARSTKQKSALSRKSNDLLEITTDYVFEIIELCMVLIDHGIVVFEKGWSPVRGDSGASVSAAMAGVMSGIFVANLNLKKLGVRNYSSGNISRCQELYARLQTKQTKAFSCVVALNSEALDAIQLELDGT